MNDVLFVCWDCRTYVKCGYRWCYWQLEHPGIVRRGEPVDAASVLSQNAYWNPPQDDESAWLYKDIFPSVRLFLDKHKGHRVVYTDMDVLFQQDDWPYHWLEVGVDPHPSPRQLAEVLGLKRWDEVLAWRAALPPTSYAANVLQWREDKDWEVFREAFQRYSDGAGKPRCP